MPPIALHLIPLTDTSELTFQCLRIQITTPDGLITPSDLQHLTLPEAIIWSQGIILEGKAPIWLYSFLTHACHPATWVACFDPRLGDAIPYSGGAVVVATHSREVAVGQVLIINLPP